MLRAAALSLLPWHRTHLSYPPQLSTHTEEDEPERQQQEEEDEDEGSGVQTDPMFQQTAYLLEGPEDMVASSGGLKSPDWVYESYYRMSLQHPLIVFLLLIVMGACLALLAVFFATGLVRLCSLSTYSSVLFCLALGHSASQVVRNWFYFRTLHWTSSWDSTFEPKTEFP